jgi:hypothetical protein
MKEAVLKLLREATDLTPVHTRSVRQHELAERRRPHFAPDCGETACAASEHHRRMLSSNSSNLLGSPVRSWFTFGCVGLGPRFREFDVDSGSRRVAEDLCDPPASATSLTDLHEYPTDTRLVRLLANVNGNRINGGDRCAYDRM